MAGVTAGSGTSTAAGGGGCSSSVERENEPRADRFKRRLAQTAEPPFPDCPIQASADNPRLHSRLTVRAEGLADPEPKSRDIVPVRVNLAQQFRLIGRRDVVNADDISRARYDIRLCQIRHDQGQDGPHGDGVGDGGKELGGSGIQRLLEDLDSLVRGG